MSDKAEEGPNPYANRDHELSSNFNKDDAVAMAGLLGAVSGELGRIDEQNVGGQNQFVQAKKMDPRQILKDVTGNPISQPVPKQPIQPTITTPVQQVASPVASSHPVSTSPDLEKRVSALEKIVETFKHVTRFRRGVSYTVTTSHIKGGIFKSPETILDIVANELSKGSKSITIKLNNESKDTK